SASGDRASIRDIGTPPASARMRSGITSPPRLDTTRCGRQRPTAARQSLAAMTLLRREDRDRWAGGEEILSRRVRREVGRHVGADERILFCLRGSLDHSLVALEDRILLVKPGFHAGTTFGSLVTTLHYSDVTGVQVHTFLLSGWIEISSPSFQGRERKRNRWPHGQDRDVYKLPNCIPISRRRLDDYQPALRRLMDQLAQFKRPVVKPAQRSSLLVDADRVADLAARGVISEEEHVWLRALIAPAGS